ncbi:MAG: hypothetical protein AXA67_13195 [Methylothermaceae bacteria B42]|nr:MAG: hypothetical protein AXA67_13195 [Methylothermaceae bacteria B42]HHJ38421.1 hypothetical protein [Methylothermaceae bacterium]
MVVFGSHPAINFYDILEEYNCYKEEKVMSDRKGLCYNSEIKELVTVPKGSVGFGFGLWRQRL